MKNLIYLFFFITIFSSCTDVMDDMEVNQTDEIQSEKSTQNESTHSIVDDLNGLIR